jgi:hypothetical protein
MTALALSLLAAAALGALALTVGPRPAAVRVRATVEVARRLLRGRP